MALFRDAMLLVHDWAALSMWTGTETGYCRTITWELGYLGCINPPCGLDEWQIKELEVVVMPGGGDDIRFQWCVCVHRTLVCVISAGMLPILVILVIGLTVRAALWDALTGGLAVMVGVASGSSNERAQRGFHLPRGSQDHVYKARADRELFT